MSTTGPEHNSASHSEIQALLAEVNRLSAKEIVDALKSTTVASSEVKASIDATVNATGAKKPPDVLDGEAKDKQTTKGKAVDVRKAVQQVLLGAGKLNQETSAGKPVGEMSPLASTMIQKLSERISAQDVSEQSAPYIHSIIQGALEGRIKSVDDLQTEFKKVENLKYVSPEIHKRIQQSCVEVAKDKGIAEAEAVQKFEVKEEIKPQPVENPPVQESSTSEQPEKKTNTQQPTPDEYFDAYHWPTYTSFFNAANEKSLVKALYSPAQFTTYVEQLKQEIAHGRNPNEAEVRTAASKELEHRIVGLFGKIYTKLDHDKPKEFFDHIEQEDPMYGVMRVKSELKRRINALASEFHRLEESGGHHDSLGLFKSAEMRPEMADVLVGKDGKMKPRMRISPYTKPVETSVPDFIHYLDQIVDHYLDARKYTHNARAIFYHPVDHEKGFYGQLARFSEEMTTVDFDQMLSLPDGDLFQDALWLYDKHVEEAFAKHDWQHATGMFETMQNSVRTHIEDDVLKQLVALYGHSVDTSRLEAALTMAVGASRGIFLTEIEKASFADPHLTPDGKATFASYYNQDNAALTAFNPMHHHYRWQSTNTIDPVFFMPVEGTKGGQGFVDHKNMWKKMKAYQDSFLKGRKPGGIEGETLFADFLVNIGKVGGPLQRKGWRTTFMLESLYYMDNEGYKEGKIKNDVIDHVKTWKRFENIGYEIAQDFVAKLNADFAASYKGYKGAKGVNGEENNRYVRQKKELFRYLYGKYFGLDESGADSYVDSLRSSAEKDILAKVRAGTLKPADIQAEIETSVTKTYLNQVLARLVAQRMPSKILRIDRDRLSPDGVSRWRKIAEEMFPKKEFGSKQSETFDQVMRDLMFAEQILRRSVSNEMKKITNTDEQWRWGAIDYKLTPDIVRKLLTGKYDQGRVDLAAKLLERIQAAYLKPNSDFLNKTLVDLVKDRDKYRYTFGLEEVDLAFIPWRGAGNRVLPRALGDLSAVEMNVSKEITKLPAVFKQIAIDGKHDFSPVIEIMTKTYNALDGIIGTDYAHQVVHNIAAMTISYFKKDTKARILGGVFGFGRKNSLAAERVGSGYRVWEWDSREIDKFCYVLESRGLLPLTPNNPTNVNPTYEPTYISLPFLKKPVKLPESMKVFGKEIRLFSKRKADFHWTTKGLRQRYGGTAKDIAFDVLNKYLPIMVAWLLWKYIKDAFDEAEKKKK